MTRRTEAEIMKNWHEDHDGPLVTVLAISYCHEKYLRTALDGILSQETDFPFEVIVHDDASPDGSADIIREYAENYPEIIRPILQEENQFSKGVRTIMRAVKPYIRGRYLAYLDCDDYWTDVNKLQEQVDYLEAHPAFIAVAHNCTVVGADGAPIDEQYPECRDEEFTPEHFFNDILAGQLSTLVVRDIFTKSPEDHQLLLHYPPGPMDRVINITLLQNGRIHCIQKTMSAYRHVTDSGTSYSATVQFDIRRDARFYLSFVNYCKKMGRIGDAIGMLRWLTEYIENYKYGNLSGSREADSLLAFCRKSIASLTDRLTQNTKALAQLTVYVQQPEDTYYTEEKSVHRNVVLERQYSCLVPLSDFGEITNLRIDPMDNYCVLRNISVNLFTAKGEKVSANILQTNAASFQDAFIFDTDDPQIEVSIPKGIYKSVSFSSELVSCDSEAVNYLKEAVNYLKEAGEIEAKLKQSEAERTALSEQLTTTCQALTEELASTRRDLDAISESTFWKITKPARIIADTVKKAPRRTK